MSTKLVLIAIALAVGISVISTTAFAGGLLPDGTKLSIIQGVGAGTNHPCDTGSCFSMVNGNKIDWVKFGPGTDDGFILGKDQMPGPQKDDGTSVESGDLTTEWPYFGNHGSNATAPFCATGVATCVTTGASANRFYNSTCISQVECLGKTKLGSWHVAWNGIAIPMGSELGCKARDSDQSGCIGVTEWTLSDNPAKIGSTYILKHSWVVPDGDPSGFANVHYSVILRGLVTEITSTCYNAATQTYKCDSKDPCILDICNGVTGACTTEQLNFDDGNDCTFDTCDKSGVVHVNLTDGSPCTVKNPDGSPNACMVNDICISGNCVGTTKPGCVAPDECIVATCNKTNGNCELTPKDCNLHDKCSTDSCDKATGCVHIGSSSCVNSGNNNFTMIDPSNGLVGGTNDVHFTWDRTTKTSVAVSGQESNATITSPCPFFGSTWTAHDVAVYGPGTYTVYASCPAGSPACVGGTNPITFTVGEEELAGHMLFNWTTNKDIDVVDIWTPHATFGKSPMQTGAGGCGVGNSAQVWDLMSKDWDGDGVNGKGMVDGPFKNFNANFNLMETANKQAPTKPELIFPADKATELPLTVEFRWKRSTDLDNDPITYIFTSCTDSTFPDTCAPVTIASRSSKGMFYAGGAGLLMIGMTFFGGWRGKRRIVLLFIVVVLLSGGALISCNNSNNSKLQGKFLDIGEKSFTVSGLSSRTTYYWKVSAGDGKADPTESNVNSFTTE